jgi:hypothetical protein
MPETDIHYAFTIQNSLTSPRFLDVGTVVLSSACISTALIVVGRCFGWKSGSLTGAFQLDQAMAENGEPPANETKSLSLAGEHIKALNKIGEVFITM